MGGRYAATNGTHQPFRMRHPVVLICPCDSKLSKEDEAAVGKDEIEVRREDQDKINKFSRLHQRETVLEDELKAKAVLPLRMLIRCIGLANNICRRTKKISKNCQTN